MRACGARAFRQAVGPSPVGVRVTGKQSQSVNVAAGPPARRGVIKTPPSRAGERRSVGRAELGAPPT